MTPAMIIAHYKLTGTLIYAQGNTEPVSQVDEAIYFMRRALDDKMEDLRETCKSQVQWLTEEVALNKWVIKKRYGL